MPSFWSPWRKPSASSFLEQSSYSTRSAPPSSVPAAAHRQAREEFISWNLFLALKKKNVQHSFLNQEPKSHFFVPLLLKVTGSKHANSSVKQIYLHQIIQNKVIGVPWSRQEQKKKPALHREEGEKLHKLFITSEKHLCFRSAC